MFKINYRGKFYEINSYIEVNFLEFLIYLKECDKVISSNELTKENFKNFLILKNIMENFSETKIIEEGLYEFKNLKFNALNFKELLNIYRSINYSSKNYIILKEILKIEMKKRLSEYKNRGLDIGIYGLKALVRNAMATYPKKCDIGIEDLVIEYSNFLKIKAYESMNLYELLSEKDRILRIIKNNDEKLNIGFPDVNIETLKNKIFPAIKTLIKLKEDIYMLELFNLYRDLNRQNPYMVNNFNYKENKNSSFFYVENAKAIFEYNFYEKLGINTEFFEEDIETLHSCQYQYISEYLYSIGYFAINKIKYTNAFISKLYLLKKKYGHSKFIKYFLDYLERVIRIT